MSNDILFVSYGASHVLMLKDIYKFFLDENKNVKYLALTAAEDYLCEENLPYDTLNLFYKDEKTLNSILKEFDLEVDKKNYYTATGLLELIDTIGISKAKELFRKYKRGIFCQKNLADEILDYFKPNILVSSNMTRLVRALFLKAKKRGIKTVYIEDLFMVPEYPFIDDSVELNELSYPKISLDYIITFSSDVTKTVQRNLKRNNIENNSIIKPLGNPNIENILLKNTLDKKISFSYSYDLYLSNKFERDLTTDFLFDYYKNSNRILIVKTHPLENEKYYSSKFKDLENVKIISEKKILLPLIKGADNILGTNTTALLESNLLKKATFCINPKNSDYLNELFIETKVAENIVTLKDLDNALNTKNRVSSFSISLNSVKNITSFIKNLL